MRALGCKFTKHLTLAPTRGFGDAMVAPSLRALKRLYLKVHPDLFNAYPDAKVRITDISENKCVTSVIGSKPEVLPGASGVSISLPALDSSKLRKNRVHCQLLLRSKRVSGASCPR